MERDIVDFCARYKRSAKCGRFFLSFTEPTKAECDQEPTKAEKASSA